MFYLSCYSKWQIFIFKIRENTAFYESNPISLLAMYEKSRKNILEITGLSSHPSMALFGVFLKILMVRIKQLKS